MGKFSVTTLAAAGTIIIENQHIDLFSRRVICWSAQPLSTTDLALQALLAPV